MEQGERDEDNKETNDRRERLKRKGVEDKRNEESPKECHARPPRKLRFEHAMDKAQVHLAREMGTHYLAAGHHATERYGVQAMGEWLASEFGVEHRFVDIDNPA